MKLEIKDGIVVCSLENKNHDFLYDCYGAFDGYYKYGYLKLAEPTGSGEDDRVLRYLEHLETVIGNAGRYGVEVTDEVTALWRTYQTNAEVIQQRYREQDAEYSRRVEWQKRKKNGCEGCQNLCRWNDDFICWKTKDVLPTENKPRNGFLFNYVAFPSDNCPHKADPIDECDESYKAWQSRKLYSEF